MTALVDRAKPRAGVASLVGASLPQVNLLPPEIRARRGLTTIKRWLGLGLIATVVLCGLAFTVSLVSAASAKSDLLAEQQRTSDLQAEQAKYAEVPQVLNALDAAKSARTLGMATEVRWKSYLDAISAVLPDEVSIQSLSVSAATPMAAAAGPTNPLQAASVGQIQISGRSSTLPNVAALVDALNAVPGFSDAWVSSVGLTGSDDAVYYSISSTVQVTESAYANRFAPTTGAS